MLVGFPIGSFDTFLEEGITPKTKHNIGAYSNNGGSGSHYPGSLGSMPPPGRKGDRGSLQYLELQTPTGLQNQFLNQNNHLNNSAIFNHQLKYPNQCQ